MHFSTAKGLIRPRRTIGLLAFLSLWPAPALAQADTPDAPDAGELPAPSADDDFLKVFSASQQEEPLPETPVPVTVVTADMIRSIGARNLQEVLITFVPGVTLVADQNEINFAMRGIYGSAQQKVLVLLDGHRMNSRAYSMADLDFSIGVDHIRQIEVLRGPGSSLYGNVALTAVVNIVTKSGREADGLTARVGLGNYGQETGSALFGKDFDGGDFLIWLSYFKASGEPRSISAAEDYAAAPRDGTAILMGVRDPASYDLGVRARAGHFSILAETRNGKLIEPFTGGGATGEVFDYGAFRTLGTLGPGLASKSNHLELAFARALSDRVYLSVSAYYDDNELSTVLIGNPALNAASYLIWNDDDVGGIAQVRTSYQVQRLGEGNVTVGFQLERMRLLDSTLLAAVNGEWARAADTSEKRVLERGSELIYSGFAQLKQRITPSLIANLGIRYDLKDRYKGNNVEDFSPRLALIYAPSSSFDVKLSYSQSFVDAPYWYRYNSLPSYRGAESLTPEHLKSAQITPSLTLFNGKLKNGLNLFYNHLSDFVFRNNAAAASEPIYQNAGVLRTVGVEEELSLSLLTFKLRANATYQHVLEGRDYGTRGTQIYNVPSFAANVVVDFNPFYSLSNKVWLNVNLGYVSEQLSPVDITFLSGTTVVAEYKEPDRVERQRTVVNLGVRLVDLAIEGVEGLSIDATLYNALDQQYSQGGSVVHPYPQPGRWVLARMTYHLPY